MRKLIKGVFIASYLVWGTLFFYSVAMLVLYNVYFESFEYLCKDADAFQIDESSKQGKIDIIYSFEVDGSIYREKESFFKDVFYQRMGNKPSRIIVCYNASFPSFTYLKDINFKGRSYNTALTLGSFFLLLTIVFDAFGNKDRMARKYEKAFTH